MEDLSRRYNMTHSKKGKCILFNNMKFAPSYQYSASAFRNRSGTNKDADNLENLFRELGYTVERYNDVEADTIKSKLTSESKNNHEDENSFICVILSHGENGIIYGSDSRPIHVEAIMNTMRGTNCPTLVGKPKIFIVQSCHEEMGIEESDAAVAAGGEDEEENIYSIPAEADVLYVCSMIPGSLTWSEGKSGSVFIDNLCKVFKQNGKHQDLLWLLTRVNYEISLHNAELLNKGKHDVPQIISMLSKDFIFS